MRINQFERAGESGSVFLVAIGMTALFALVIASYLTLVEGHSASVARSQSYNSAIPVAEAGVEEALSLLNKGGVWSNNLTADGWSSMAGNTTTKSNLVSNAAYYQVTISNQASGNPMIISTGVVPFNSYTWAVDSMTSSNNYLSSATIALMRTVQVQTTTLALSSGAIIAKSDVVFHGGANVDSFNSANSNLSANGQYTPTKVHDKAVVATDTTVSQAISGTGNIDIRGFVNTGPGGTVLPTGNTSIGDNNWVSNSTSGIETSRSNDNFNVAFPDVSAPTATYVESPILNQTVGGTNYSMVFEGNQYWGSSNVLYNTSISISGQKNVLITGGAVTIYIPPGGDFSFGGQTYLYVAPGSSVSIYCAASSASIGGNGFMGSTNAADISFYGLPTLTSISYGGNAAFVGTVYAPEADFKANGNAEIIGALMANSFDFVGNAAVHYDEHLAGGPSSGFVASGWQEIATPAANLTLPP
jgi:hypothetical protein